MGKIRWTEKVSSHLQTIHEYIARDSKTSLITHNNSRIFEGISNPLRVGRYHSLEIKQNPLCLEVIAQTEDGIIMGVKHKQYPIYGLQFHPESIITDEGLKIIENFLKCV